MHTHATTTGPDTHTQAINALGWAISEMQAVLNPPPLTRENLCPRLLAVCRELTDHLSEYAISASVFDEDAFWTCQQAETLLSEARRLPGQPAKPHEALLAAAKEALMILSEIQCDLEDDRGEAKCIGMLEAAMSHAEGR